MLCLFEQLERTKNYVPKKQFWKAVNVLEYKFLSIPIAFFLLRMWTCIINLFYIYIRVQSGNIPQPLVYLSVSVISAYTQSRRKSKHFLDKSCFNVNCLLLGGG